MPEFWCGRRKIFRHQRLCFAAGVYLEKGPPPPTPCTFPSTVSGSSWVSFAVWVVGMWKHWGRTKSWSCSQPLLWSTSSASFCSLVFSFLLGYVVSFDTNWFLLFHCTLYYFFVLVRMEISLLVLNIVSLTTLFLEWVCPMCAFLQEYLEQNGLKHNLTNSNLPTLPGIISIIHNKSNLRN